MCHVHMNMFAKWYFKFFMYRSYESFARFDEIPLMAFQAIKETKHNRLMDANN